MNEVFDEIIGKINKAKTPMGVKIKSEQFGVNVKLNEENVRMVMVCVVLVFSTYNYAPYTFDFNSSMSDDELEEVYDKFEERLTVLRNLG
uniref:Uncharacterized protein n=1 Tax=Siphoviridae sp. ctmHK36 TaxID=2827931 RepID=A0A8S5TAR8_9CAUD|nr:MAG TPA: hypothetical protein [Siphoviridae sp. ctmHK36]